MHVHVSLILNNMFECALVDVSIILSQFHLMFSVLEEIISYINDATIQQCGCLNSNKVLIMSSIQLLVSTVIAQSGQRTDLRSNG